MSFQDNYKVRDALRKIKYYRINSYIDSLVKEVKQIDSISDYVEFKKFIKKNIKKKSLTEQLAKHEFGSEGLHYGHRKAFFDYAGIETDEQRYIFPFFEHSADLRERGISNIREPLNHSLVFQSTYKNEIAHRERPLCPVYNIGPYILYAKQYYSGYQLKKIKDSLGKTALLFPAHTFEGASIDFDKQKFVKEVFDRFKHDFDSIMVCAYWMDVDDPIYDAFEAEGAKIVSAGFRGDDNFIARQRVMYELSDLVSSNLEGSYIGYSLALKKPFYMFSNRARLNSHENIGSNEQEYRFSLTVNKIFKAFSNINPSYKQLDEQQSIFEYYWGGLNQFKTREEASKIITLNMKLLKKSKYTTYGYEKCIIDVLQGNNKANIDNDELLILKKALGNKGM